MRKKADILLMTTILLGIIGAQPMSYAGNTISVFAQEEIHAERGEGNSIVIKIPAKKKDVDILRSDKEDGDYTKIGTIKKGETIFIDGGGDVALEDKTWYYKVGDTIINNKGGSTESLTTTDTDAITRIKEGLAEHKPEIVFYYEGYTKGLAERLIRECVDQQNKEMIVETKADYYAKRNDVDVYKIIYTLNYDMTPEQESELKEKQKEILDNLEATIDAERVCEVYKYLCTHVVESKDGSSAYDALIKNKANSEGVSKAMYNLLEAIGVECRIVNNENGYFNIVKMADGLWYDLDVYAELQSINTYEYLRYDFLLTPRMKLHTLNEYNTNTARQKWRFSKVRPENITASTEEDGLTLHWDRVAHASGYKVQRSTEPDGAYTDVISKEDQKQEERGLTNTNSITDITAEAGKTYYYRVKAYTDHAEEKRDEGPYSDVFKVRYFGQVNLGINTSGYSPLLEWDAVKDVDSYRVYRKATGEEEELLTQTDKTSFVDTTASYTKNYSYRVQVVKNTASSERGEYYSNTATTYGISEIRSTKDGLEIKWKSQDKNESYRLYRWNEKTHAYAIIARLKPEERVYVDKAVTAGESKKYCIAPYVENENGRSVNIKSIKKEGVLLEAPELTGVLVDDIPYILWTSVSGANAYELYINGKKTETVSCAETSRFLTDYAGKKIKVQVLAKTLSNNTSALSKEFEIGR